MKWVKEYYGYEHLGYHQYRCGEYVIRQTHGENMFTGREMSSAYQIWEIFKNGEKIDFGTTFREAKQIVARMVKPS